MGTQIKTMRDAQVVLNEWGSVYIEHANVVEFIRWLEANPGCMNCMSAEDIASKYLKVDMARLDQARRFLLNQERSLIKQPQTLSQHWKAEAKKERETRKIRAAIMARPNGPKQKGKQ